jgi:hypothetical protein
LPTAVRRAIYRELVNISGSVLLTAVGVVLPVIAAVVAAWIAKRAADRATAAQVDMAHLQRLEQRIAGRKLEVYEPILDYLRESLRDADNIDADEMTSKLSKFSGWVAIVGSDAAVRAFGNHMQGAYNDAPGLVAMRLYADFLLAARRDLGDPASQLTGLDVWAMQINDLYSTDGKVLRDTLTLPLERACALHEWVPPWSPARPELD